MKKYKYFKLSEFDSPDIPNSGVNMNFDFLDKLDKIRGLCGFPFVINSGYRSKAYNQVVRGEFNSAHLRGLACDIHCVTSFERFCIIQNALKVGIKRIGIYPTFIHLDDDDSLVQNVIFVGK